MRTKARHQINVIPIGSIKSPRHNLPSLAASSEQRARLARSLIITSCPEAGAGALTALHLRQLPSHSDHLTLWEACQPASPPRRPMPQPRVGVEQRQEHWKRKGKSLREGWPNSLAKWRQKRSQGSLKHVYTFHANRGLGNNLYKTSGSTKSFLISFPCPGI